MRTDFSRRQIMIRPDNSMDTAYIEDTLGLKKDGDYIKLKRRNAEGLSCIACIETDCEGVFNDG